MFGYNFGDVKTRMDRFAEGIAVISSLIRSDETFTYQGHYYQLQDAHLLPRPKRSTPIMIGGNGQKRTLPLVAQYADIWNCQCASPDAFRAHSILLDELIAKAGRKNTDVKRTVFLPVICWTSDDELENILDAYRQAMPGFAPMSTEEILGIFKNYFAAIAGTPDSVIQQIRAYEEVGAEEMMIQWMIVDHIAGLETIAKYVLPEFRS
jgi:alkanesulfonate monooxygenase SsuD/methylene tetrahydromethanopterin reductase-like flavin-dependent oxidoreductase (luciferase family)